MGGDLHAIASIPFKADVSLRLIGYFNEQSWFRRRETVSSYSSTLKNQLLEHKTGLNCIPSASPSPQTAYKNRLPSSTASDPGNPPQFPPNYLTLQANRISSPAKSQSVRAHQQLISPLDLDYQKTPSYSTAP